MKILVTGGLGFIGSNFIEWILDARPEVCVLNLDRGDYVAREHNVRAEFSSRYTWVKCDITEKYHVLHIFNEFRPDIVVHFAAQSCVDLSFEKSFKFTKDNVIGTQVLLEVMKDAKYVKKFIHISTDEVYGEVGPDVISNETSPFNPTSPYAASKAAAELYVKAYGHSWNIPYIITRGNNVFGPKQYPEKLVPIFIRQMLNDVPCTIHGNGEYRRNFIYVDDVSRAVDLIIQNGQIGHIYNIGSGHEYSVTEIFEKLSKFKEGVQSIHIADPRPYNDSRYCIDSSNLRELGWTEDADFDACLAKTWDWYKMNSEWW